MPLGLISKEKRSSTWKLVT